MTNLLTSAPLLFALTLFLELYAITVGEAQVQDTSKAVSVSYSLPTTQLSLHEPIVIAVQINNETTQGVSLDLGQDKKGGFLFTVTSPDGTTLQLPQYSREGISQYGNVSVQPGESFSQRLILNEWYNHFNVPGKYILGARLTTPIVIGKTLHLQDTGFTGEISITHRDPARLEKVCAELAKQVETAPNPEAAQEPALALSFIEDPIAVPYLARMLATKTLTYDKAIAGLKRIGDDAAVEVLLSALNNGGDISDNAAHALSQMLDKISDARLKETVKNAVERTSERERNEFIQTHIAYLGYRDPNLQQTAIQELVRVDGLQQAEPALQRLANDPNQPADVRAAAKDALQKLHPPQR
jgi:hypothetical protein